MKRKLVQSGGEHTVPFLVLFATLSLSLWSSGCSANGVLGPGPGDPPPVISNIGTANIGPSAATVTWTTSAPATSQVEYGPTINYGSSTTLDSAFVTNHAQTLSGLTPGTLHHFRVRSRDSGGREATSGDFTFTTSLGPDTTPPTISGVKAVPNVNHALILWATDKSADSQVEYGTSTSYGQRSPVDLNLVVGHSVSLIGLTPSTLYHYRVWSRGAAGSPAVSGDFTFMTLAQPPGGGIPPALGWFEAPNTKLRNVCPPPDPLRDAIEGCAAVISGWNGGIADTARDRLIIWGGGHNDYHGNEIYAFDLNSLTMNRLNDPSPPNPTPNLCRTTLADGAPNSRHTYGGLAYIEHADRMFVFGGEPACDAGGFTDDTWTLDLATLQWTRKDPHAGGTPAANPGTIAAYDPNTHLVFLNDLHALWSYNYDTNTYAQLNPNANIDYRMNGVIDPKRKLFFVIGSKGTPDGTGGIKVFNIAAGSDYQMQDWTSQVTGCDGLLNVGFPSDVSGYPGLAYDPVQDRILGWPNFGNTVYLFNPDTKSCTTRIFSGGPPNSTHGGTPNNSNGTHGRFRYFPGKGVLALVNDWNINAFTLRLTSP